MKKTIIGSFAFRDEGNGCLTAKWMNDSAESPFSESCKLYSNENTKETFCGKYKTSWIQDGYIAEDCDLIIEKNKINSALYKLYWKETKKPNAVKFEGSAMLFQGLLVGAYWD